MPLTGAARRARALIAAVCAAAVQLSGCDNARENLVMSEWRQVGTAAAPIPRLKGDLKVTPEVSGSGRIVVPGDLVKVRVTVTIDRRYAPIGIYKQEPIDVWLWTGREPDGRDYSNVNSWGDLGSARARAVLIGRAIGDRFRLAMGERAEGYAEIPMQGFIAQDEFLIRDDGTNARAPVRKSVVIAKSLPSELIYSDIEILDACEGRLLRRTATMYQSGIVGNIFDMNYKPSRDGTLRWSALEGDCGAPAGKVHLEVGPLYFYRDRRDLALYNWSDSYRRLRPPVQNPLEYDTTPRSGMPRALLRAGKARSDNNR